MKEKKISNLKVKELYKIRKEIFNDEKLFDFSFNEIGKLFLSKILNINIYQSDFLTIRNKYIKSSENNHVSENEIDFYKEICLEYLDLEKVPKTILYSSYQEVTKDLQKIEEHILYLTEEMNNLEIKKQNKNIKYNTEDRYYFNKLNFYKEKNITAKNEIINFLVNDIKNDAIKKSQRDLFNMKFNPLMGKMPYSFSKCLFLSDFYDEFDVKDLTPISNKFLDLAISSHHKIRDLYHTNKKEFFEFTKEYISEEIGDSKNIINQITTYIKTNHILNRRKNVLEVILNHYKNKDYISVVNMLPLQIEGIFHDICIEFGINESQSNKTSINELLKILDQKTKSFHYFEYYSFIFPITRNKVAHGELIEDNLEHTAIMLILDLIPVCMFAISDEIKINKTIDLIKTIEKTNCNKKLIQFIEYIDINIPNFYNMQSSKENILNKYNEDTFWYYLREEILKNNNEDISSTKIIEHINKLKKRKIANEKCKTFFRDIPKLQNEIKEKKNKLFDYHKYTS